MRTRNLTLALFFLLFSNFLFAQGFGKSELLKEWYFIQEDVKLGNRITLDHSNWDKVIVPHDWSVENFASPDLSSCTGYLPGGIGWYRTEFETKPEQIGKKLYLYFEGVYNRSEVYINGVWLGKRPNGYISFMYDITPYVKTDAENVIAVRVDHSLEADSRWYTGSGIYRNVHLLTASQLHIDQWGVYYTAKVLSNEKASVNIETTINNHSEKGSALILQELLDEEGKVIAKTKKTFQVSGKEKNTLTQQLTIANPNLWSIEKPYLYKLNTKVVKNGKTVDETTTNVGIRKLTFDRDKGFALNDKWMKIKGVCLHHDAGVLGAAVPKVVWKERLLKLKEIGVNGIRMSHNPQATDLYDLCDELGFVVMDEGFDEWEFPKKKWLTGWNHGTPGFQGSADFFHEWNKTDLRDLVLRDRNHPCIIMWSIGNEVDYPNDPYSHPVLDSAGIGQIHALGYKKDQPHAERLGYFAKELAAEVRKLDTSRPVTAALAGPVMSNFTDYPGALDVVGYNYTESRYQLDHDTYPERILYGSENRHDLEAWKAVTDNEFIFGQFIWTGYDYLGEAGQYPSRGFVTGMCNQANQIKPRGYFRKALWNEKPNVYVGTYPVPKRNYISMDAPQIWNYEDGQEIRVVCYTNCEEAELLLNGKVIGERKPYNEERAIIHWDVEYKPGELEVVCYNNQEVAAKDLIFTNSAPAKIIANSSTNSLSGKYDVAIVNLDIVDENGNVVTLADNNITCNVLGNGELLGLENASNNVAENYLDNKHRCKNGHLVAYIRSTDDEGEINVEFTSPFLEKATVRFEIKK